PQPTRPNDSPHEYWRRIHLFDDGSLLALSTTANRAPQGAGLVKLDRESNAIWSYSGRTHHDFDIDSNGDIFALAHRQRTTSREPVSGMPHLPEKVLGDNVVRLSPTGRERERISLLDAMAESTYAPVLQMHPRTVERPGETEWDVLHASSVAVIGPQFAGAHAVADPGDLLLSFRAVDLVAVLDYDRRRISWATRGAWWQPTDADPLPDGDILVFDSNGHGAAGLPSRILK
ncbi:MAG: arylsulfotransferase family protein, partial [Bradymonadaceae bacterium]